MRTRAQEARRKAPLQCTQVGITASNLQTAKVSEEQVKGPLLAEKEESSMKAGLASPSRVSWPQETLLITEMGLLKFPLLTVIFQDEMTDEENM